MRKAWWGLLLGLTLCAAQASELPKDIRLASDAWVDYSEADGRGLAWDVLREIFEPAVTVQVRSEPYTRSIGLVQRGEADAWVGSYYQEIDTALYPHWNFDTDHIYALGLASSAVPNLKNIGDYRLAWVRGYEYQDYLPGVRHFSEVQRRGGILPMLQHGRADYYIDALAEVDAVLNEAPEPSRYRRSHLAELPLYLGFADNPRGRALLAFYDQRMGELVKSGALRAVFARWKQPYPFEDAAAPAQ